MENDKNIMAIILAAGKGTRMKSAMPKVLHEIFNKPLVGWVLDCVESISDIKDSIVVLGHGADSVDKYLNSRDKKVLTVIQEQQLGTGHAVAQTLPLLSGFSGEVLIVCGDTPLITSKTLDEFINYHRTNNSDLTVMTTCFDNPFGYGRIVRDSQDRVIEIVEQKDATELQKQIKEVNTGIYLLNWSKISSAFSQLKNSNAQNEYYLTDIVKWANDNKYKVSGYVAQDNTEIYGINSRSNLAAATKIMKDRKLESLMENGVTIVDVSSTFVSPDTEIAEDTIIYPNTYIEGKNKISKNCKIGPMARLRGGCFVGEGCKIGNFVELKNAKIADKTNVCHLSYVGDAIIGSNVNVGAGTIFANYNSITKEKKQSVLSDGVSIGSNSVIVAPVELGKNAFVGALSCVTKNADNDSLVICRAPQREVKNWVKNKKENN